VTTTETYTGACPERSRRDNNGNTATKVDSNGTTTYAWDSQNRLASVTLPGSGGTVTFKYDPFGRRIQKVSPAGTTNYLYDGANVIEEVDSTGTVLARYAQGAGLDQPLDVFTGSATKYYDADGLGSVTSLADISGSLTDTYVTDSFGNTTASSGSTRNPFRYTARDLDSETGLYYYRARYYDPHIGRFISEDSVRFAEGANFYRYAENNPVEFTDPFGHGAWSCIKCIFNLYRINSCLESGRQCRQKLDRQYPNPLDLCSATNSPNPGDAYFKQCFAKNPQCQKLIQSCGQCGLWPARFGDPHFFQ